MTEKTSKTPQGIYKQVGDILWVHYEGRTFTVPLKYQASSPSAKRRSSQTAQSSGDIRSPMPGKIHSVNCKPGDTVKAGQTICVIEAMKMEYALKAPFDGKIKSIKKAAGELVALDELIADM